MAATPDMQNATLPTLDRLGVKLADDADIDALKIAREWFSSFSQAIQSGSVSDVLPLLLDNGSDTWWRDIISLTNDIRTFYGESLPQFLSDRVVGPSGQLSEFKLDEASIAIERPYADIVWIQAMFTFRSPTRSSSGIFRLVPTSSITGSWLAHSIFTNLEGLNDFPEQIKDLREQAPNHGKWHEKRKREIECLDEDPKVIVVGGGQAGLEIAARLKYLGVKTLVVEREPRVGNLWRKRYEALCLHDTVWYDHMPYLPFPPTWPVFAPAPKLADWLENYAHSLELDVWTSSTILSCTQDPTTHTWSLSILRPDGTVRNFENIKHLVMAVGLGGGVMRMPSVEGADEFSGKIIHSGQFKTAKEHIGQKVVVVGACTSAHDICLDLSDHGVDVTMFQRSSTYVLSTKHGVTTLFGQYYSENGPPVDIGDRLNASFPNYFAKLLHQRLVHVIAEKDKETLDGLRRVGFKLNWGEQDAGFILSAWNKAGGYYLDVGGSQAIIDGRIKLKSSGQISRFTKNGLLFDDGSTLDADVVIFATGYGDTRDTWRKIIDPATADKLKPIWGLDKEGEIQSAWRDSGVEGLYCMMGNLALCRFYSKSLALQIKAMEEGIFGERYSI